MATVKQEESTVVPEETAAFQCVVCGEERPRSITCDECRKYVCWAHRVDGYSNGDWVAAQCQLCAPEQLNNIEKEMREEVEKKRKRKREEPCSLFDLLDLPKDAVDCVTDGGLIKGARMKRTFGPIPKGARFESINVSTYTRGAEFWLYDSDEHATYECDIEFRASNPRMSPENKYNP